MSDSNTAEGGCLCGAVRYECDPSAALSASHCHCRDCQRSTGSGFTTFFAIPETGFRVVSGKLGSFAVTGESGQELRRSFCTACGSPIFSETALMPALRFVKAGSLDDPSWVDPTSAYWGSSAQPWAPPFDGIQVHDKNPS